MEYDANLQGRLISFNDEPNVTLLYDASYFGHAHLVRYLLQQRGNPDTPVKLLVLLRDHTPHTIGLHGLLCQAGQWSEPTGHICDCIDSSFASMRGFKTT